MKNKLIDLSNKSSKLNNMKYKIQDYSSSISERSEFNEVLKYCCDDLDQLIFNFVYRDHVIDLNENFRPFKRTK